MFFIQPVYKYRFSRKVVGDKKMIIGIEPIMVAYETTVLPLNYIILNAQYKIS